MSVESAQAVTPVPVDAEREMARRFASAHQAADAVLFEGYVLYPYRASSAKNRLRWQFGVLMAPRHAEELAERSGLSTECLFEPRAGSELLVELRFLRVQRRVVQCGPESGPFRDVESIDLDDRVLCPWDEGVEERVSLSVPVDRLLGDGHTVAFERPAHTRDELVRGRSGEVLGRIVRTCTRLTGVIELSAAQVPVPYRTLRLRAQARNTTEPAEADAGPVLDRDAALADALVSAHLVLGLTAGSFLSPTDPPQWAKPAVAECRNDGVWPVLAGVEGRADVVLASPIILEDHPAIAPESPGAMYDLTEIDEILALRTAALTDQEKREARGTDPRAAAVVELADTLPAEMLDRLHGAIRGLREITGPTPDADVDLAAPFETAPFGTEPFETEPWTTSDGFPAALPAPTQPWWDPGADRSVDPATDHVLVDGRPVARGSRVLLRTGRRRTDAQDIFLDGRAALVEAVLHDVDGLVHIAVTLEDDPGADIQRAQGRFLYFQPDEVTVAAEADVEAEAEAPAEADVEVAERS
jgi:hypothetical protein